MYWTSKAYVIPGFQKLLLYYSNDTLMWPIDEEETEWDAEPDDRGVATKNTKGSNYAVLDHPHVESHVPPARLHHNNSDHHLWCQNISPRFNTSLFSWKTLVPDCLSCLLPRCQPTCWSHMAAAERAMPSSHLIDSSFEQKGASKSALEPTTASEWSFDASCSQWAFKSSNR